MASSQRKSYEAAFKLKVIEFSKENTIHATARKFDITTKMVRDWKKKEDVFKKIPRKKRAMRSGTAHWPILEENVSNMI